VLDQDNLHWNSKHSPFAREKRADYQLAPYPTAVRGWRTGMLRGVRGREAMMSQIKGSVTRRDVLRSGAAAAAAGWILPAGYPGGRTMADEARSPNERPRVGCIGNGGMGKGDARAIKKHGDIVAFCDVDREHAEQARDDGRIGGGKGEIYEDYRRLLDRND